MSSLRNTYNPIARKLAEPGFLYMAAMGRIPGYNTEFVIGNHPSTMNSTDELIWQHSGLHTSIPTAQPIYISSTSPADNTGAIVFVRALDANYDRVSLVGVFNGQNQVECKDLQGNSLNVIWVQSGIVQFPGSPFGALGDAYIATSSALTGGIPNDAESIQSKITAGHNITRSANFMVPRGKAAITTALRGGTDSVSKPATVISEITYFDQAPVRSVEYYLTPSFGESDFPLPVATVDISGETSVVLPERSKVEFLVNAQQINTKIFFGTDLLMGDLSLFGSGDQDVLPQQN